LRAEDTMERHVHVEEQWVRGVHVVRVHGKAVGPESRTLKEHLDQTLEHISADAAPMLVLSLGGLTFLDSAGLGAVIVAQQRIARQGGRTALASVAPHIHRALTVARLTAVLPLYPDEETAVDALIEATGRDTPQGAAASGI
jgi:stage II sporulation protein AA (anti-sigma F factor antagonist)